MDRAPQPRPGAIVVPAPAEDPRRRARRPAPGAPAFGPVLVGRDSVVGAVFHALAHPQDLGVVLHGPRRIGKSSILQHLADAVPEHTPHAALYVDLHDKAAAPLSDVLVALAASIAAVLALPDPSPAADVEPWLCDRWLPSALASLPPDASLVLLVDEMDVVDNPQESQATVALYPYLRRLLKKNAPRLRLVLALGRSTDDLENVALALFDGLPICRVPLLSREDAATLARVSASGGAHAWSDEAVDAAWALTHGHPLLLQALCANVRAQGQADRPVAPTDVQAAVEPTLTRNRSAFEWIWKGLPPAARAALAALASAGADGMSEEALFGVLQANGAREILPALRRAPQLLVDQEVALSPAPGRYRFRVELLRRLVARYKPPAYVQQDLDLVDPAAEELCRAGEAAFRKGDLSAAKARLKEALEKNPNHARAMDLLTDILIQRKEWGAARPVVERLHESKPLLARPRFVKVLLAQAEAAPTVDAQRDLYQRVQKIDAANPIATAAIERIQRTLTERPPAPEAPRASVPPGREAGPVHAPAAHRPAAPDPELSRLERALDAEKRALDAEKKARTGAEARAAALAAERDQLLVEVRTGKAEIARLAAASAEAASLGRALDAEKKTRGAVESRAVALTVERDRLLARLRAEHQPAVVVGVDPAVLEKALDAEKKARALAESRVNALTNERDGLLDGARADQADRVRVGHDLQTLALERDQLSADLDGVQAEVASMRASIAMVPLESQPARLSRPSIQPAIQPPAQRLSQPSIPPSIQSSSQPSIPPAVDPLPVVPAAARPKRRQSPLGPVLLLVVGIVVIGAAYAVQPTRLELSTGAVAMFERSDARQVSATRVIRLGKRRPAAGVSWASLDPRVATVDADGMIRPAGTGRTRVEARAGNVTASVEVRVSLPARIAVAPAEITLSPDSGEVAIEASILDGAGAPWKSDAALVWTSSDANVATTEGARVRRAGPGKAVIEGRLGDVVGRVAVVSLDRLAALQKGCDGGQLDACVALGRLEEKGGEGATADVNAALALYERACGGGAVKGCAEAGAWYEQGKGGAPDLARAVAAYQKACDVGDGLGCSRLGGMYESGWGVMRDTTKALALYRGACDAAEMDGCWHLGAMYELGTGVAREAPAAVDLYKKACDGGRPQACGSLANMYWNGSGSVPKDVPAGLALYEKACDAGHEPACTAVALKYKSGEGIAASRERSMVFFGKACAAGSKSACMIAPKPAAP